MPKHKKLIEFDRKGRCPICRKPFQSKECPHDYDYVHSVVERANSNFDEDVAMLRSRSRG